MTPNSAPDAAMRPFVDDRRTELRATVGAWTQGLPRRGRPVEGPPDATTRALVWALGEAGILALTVPATWGGWAASVEPLSLVVAREELAYASSVADALLAVQGLAAYPIAWAGEETTRARWLPALAKGTKIGAFAVTEPEAGSDLASITTSAQAVEGGYLLNGHKVFISNATVADVVVVLARTASTPDRALSLFAVPTDTPGVETTAMDLLASHLVGAVRLRDVHVPASARLGLEGDGLSLSLRTLELFRPTVGAAACGMARRALDEAIRRVGARKQFGAPLADQQSVRFALADMATDLEAARGLVYRAAWLKETQPDARFESAAAMAKLHATETAQRIVDQALQLHGAAGLVKGSVMEALYREVRALRIYEGTSEMQKLIIARGLL